MKVFFRSNYIAFLLFLVLSLTSCGGGSGTPTVALSNMVPVQLAMHLPGQTVAQADLVDKMLNIVIPDANAINLAGAVSVTVMISGNGFATIVDSFPAGAPGTQLIKQYNVPQGASRTFSIQGFNTPVGTPAAVPILSGVTTVALAPSAAPVLVDVILTPPTDTQPPVVSGPAPITVAAIDGTGTPKGNTAIAAFLAAVTATDNVDANPVVTNDAPLQFPLGPTTVTFTSTDAAGNTSIPVLVVVTVTDQSPPTIALNGANPLAVPQGSVFTDPGSVVTDNVSAGLVALVTGAVNTTVVGAYTLTYNAADAASNPATPVTRTVNVTAIAPPGTTHVWIGTTSTAWNVASNWDVGMVPGAASTVFIPAFPANQPITTGMTITALANQAGSTLSIAGNSTIATGFTNNGTIDFIAPALPIKTLTVTAGALTNAGTIINHVGAIVVANLVNTGAITVLQGLTVGGVGRSIDLTAGTVNIATGVTLSCDVASTVLIDAVGSLWAGAGTVFFDISSTVTLTGAVAHPAGTGATLFRFDTATINGAGTLTNNGTMKAMNTTFTTLVNHGSIGSSGSVVQGLFTSSTGSSISPFFGGPGDLSLNGGVNMNGVTVDNVLLTINTTAPTQFDNVTFQNYAPTATPLLLNFSNASQTYNNLNFMSPLTTGFHIGGTGTGNTINVVATNLPQGTAAAAFDAANTVNWPNRVPTSTSATITTNEDTASAGVIPAVVDPNTADTHTFTIVTQPANGVASVVANKLVYTPGLNFNGTTSFTFRATDTGGLSVIGTANVTVAPINDAPVFTVAPSIVQTAVTANTLLTLSGTATTDVDNAGAAALSYQWQANATNIPVSGTGASYTVTAADTGKAIRCIVTANDGTGSATATATATTVAVNVVAAGQFLYSNDNVVAANTVSAYVINKTTGQLTAVPGAPFATGGNGSSTAFFTINNITVSKLKNLLFATNPGSDTITVFSINPLSGVLTPVAGSPFANQVGATMGFGGSIASNPSGTLLFVGNDASKNISVFSVATSGVLTAVTGSPFALAHSRVGNSYTQGVTGIRLNDSGTTLYTTSGSVDVGAFTVAVSGSLTPLATSPYNVSARSIDIDNNKGLAVVASLRKVASFTVDAIGNLTAVTQASTGTSSYTVNTSPTVGAQQNIEFSPDGTRIVFSGGKKSSISVMAIDSAGQIAEVPGSTFTTANNSTGYTAIHPNGQWVYATESGASNFIEFFSMAANGSLTSQQLISAGAAGKHRKIAIYADPFVLPAGPDTTLPVITLLDIPSISIVQGSAYTDAGSIVTDNVDAGLSATVTGGPVNTAAAVGTVFTLNFNVLDAAGNVAMQKSRTITIVAPPNQAPTSTSATITTNEDTASAGVTPAVVDPNAGDTHTFTIVTQPANGVASVLANQLVYTPGLNFNGATSFTFRATDLGGLSVVGTASVTVLAVNDAPVLATNAGLSVNADAAAKTMTTALLQTTDVDNTAAQLTYTLTATPGKGVLKNGVVLLAINSTFTQANIDGGNISFTPRANERDADSFSFTVSDGAGGAIAATVFNINIASLITEPVTFQNKGLTKNIGKFFESVSMLPGGLEGWAVGQFGEIQHTVDGGANWTTQAIPIGLSSSALIDVHAVDSSHVWVVGRSHVSGTPLMLFYNGSVWSKVVLPAAVTGQLMDVDMASITAGYASSKDGSVLGTADGVTWTVLGKIPGAGINLLSIAPDPLNVQVVFALTDQGIFKSVNGGVAWIANTGAVTGPGIPLGMTAAQWSGRHISAFGSTIVAGDFGGGAVVASQDGGVTWTYVQVGGNFLLPQMISATVGFALTVETTDLNRVFKTLDGGLTWVPVSTAGGIGWAAGMFFLDATTGWVVGEDQLIVKIDLTPGAQTVNFQSRLFSTGKFYESVSMLPGGLEGWAVGQAGSFAHTQDGGTTWSPTVFTRLTSGAIIDVHGLDATHAWFVGRRDITGAPLLDYYDGTSWLSATVPASVTKQLMDVDMTSITTGLAASIDGKVLGTVNGTVWTLLGTVPLAPGGELLSIEPDPLNAQVVYALTSQGIFKSTNGGATWVANTGSIAGLPAGTTAAQWGGRHISVFGNTIVAGDFGGGAIISSQNGGTTWTYVQPGGNYLRPQMVSATVGFALTAETTDINQIFKTTDGGLTWAPVATAGGIGWAAGMHFINATTGWVVGEGRLIVKIDLTPGAQTVTFQSDLSRIGKFFESVSMLPTGLEGWAVGHYGEILHTTDGGTAWLAQTAPAGLSDSALIDVKAVDATHVWVVGVQHASQLPVFLFYNGSVWANVAIPAGFNSKLMSIDMVSATVGYAVSTDGSVLKTIDGVTWTVVSTVTTPFSGFNQVTGQPIAGPATLRSIVHDPLNQQVLWTLSDQGIFKSVDAGANWSGEQSVGKFIDPDTGVTSAGPFGGRHLSVHGNTIVAGDFGAGSIGQNGQSGSGILSSQDGGATWTYVPFIAGNFLRPQMLSATVGFALDVEASDLNIIFKTTDGGLHWFPIATAGGIAWAGGMQFINSTTGWVVGENDLIVKIDLSFNQAPAPVADAITTTSNLAGTSQIAPNDANLADTHIYAVTTPAVSGTATVNASGLAMYIPNAAFAGTDSFVLTVTDQGGLTGLVTIPVTVNPLATTAQSWQTLKTNGDTTTAGLQFQSAMAANPADFEAVIGFCSTQTADLMSNAAFRGLLATWTTDTGATLPTAAVLAMNVANGTKTTINWVKKFSQLAINGATVQADGFANALPVLNTCITNLEGVLAAGFVSQQVQNPADWVRFPGAVVTVDVADVNLLLSILYGARSELYWVDAYNWNTDVDADGIVDTVITSAVIGATTYQYSTMNIDPKSVFADPTFFTLRTAGALLSTGAADLTQSLADAVAGASKRKTGLTTFNGNTMRAGSSANLFYYAPGSLANLPQDLTDTTNALAALDGTGYTNPQFKQRDGTTATATIRADLAYTGSTAWDRTVMPFATMAYDVLPDPVASKKNNSPTYFDDGAGNVVQSSFYNSTYPDSTMNGVLSGAALLSNQDKSSRPVNAIVLNLAGVPIIRHRTYIDQTGFHDVSWPGPIITDEAGTSLFALEVDQNNTVGNFVFTMYSVNQVTGALTAVPGATATVAGFVNGSGIVTSTNHIYLPGASGGTIGFWDMNLTTQTVAMIQTIAPAGTIRPFYNTLRSDGTATGLIHWYFGNFISSEFATVSQNVVSGVTVVREQYGFGLDFNASPVGTDATLGWLVFDPNKSRLMRVVTGVMPQSAKVYYSPLLTGGGGLQGSYHLVAGKFLDSVNFPTVYFYSLPALASFPATGTVDVFP